MSDYKPSKYIMHSGYATVKTYEPLTASVTIPNSLHVAIDSDVIYKAKINLPTTKGIGWRSLVTSSIDSVGISTPNFLAPCKAQDEYGYEYEDFFYGSVVRVSSSVIELQIVFTASAYYAVDYSKMGQTFTLKLQPYLSPFEA